MRPVKVGNSKGVLLTTAAAINGVFSILGTLHESFEGALEDARRRAKNWIEDSEVEVRVRAGEKGKVDAEWRVAFDRCTLRQKVNAMIVLERSMGARLRQFCEDSVEFLTDDSDVGEGSMKDLATSLVDAVRVGEGECDFQFVALLTWILGSRESGNLSRLFSKKTPADTLFSPPLQPFKLVADNGWILYRSSAPIAHLAGIVHMLSAVGLTPHMVMINSEAQESQRTLMILYVPGCTDILWRYIQDWNPYKKIYTREDFVAALRIMTEVAAPTWSPLLLDIETVLSAFKYRSLRRKWFPGTGYSPVSVLPDFSKFWIAGFKAKCEAALLSIDDNMTYTIDLTKCSWSMLELLIFVASTSAGFPHSSHASLACNLVDGHYNIRRITGSSSLQDPKNRGWNGVFNSLISPACMGTKRWMNRLCQNLPTAFRNDPLIRRYLDDSAATASPMTTPIQDVHQLADNRMTLRTKYPVSAVHGLSADAFTTNVQLEEILWCETDDSYTIIYSPLPRPRMAARRLSPRAAVLHALRLTLTVPIRVVFEDGTKDEMEILADCMDVLGQGAHAASS